MTETRFRTGLVYDPRMMLHQQPTNAVLSLPEIAARLERIVDGLAEHGLVEQCVSIPSRSATKEELQLCHPEDYVQSVLDNDLPYRFGEYHVSEHTGMAAALSAGCVLQMVDAVMEGRVDNGFCVTRPPGHHAGIEQAMGFCYFANAAIAAKYAMQRHGARRVVIIDWDVHHGNGTQDVRIDDENILYISTHRNFYPFTGKIENVGSKGNTINVNLEQFGDAVFLDAFRRIVLPATREFDADLILVSAGYDAVEGDLLGGCRVSPETFGVLIDEVMATQGGRRVCCLLEGGYNLEQLTRGVVETVRCLLGHPPRGMAMAEARSSGINASVIDRVLKQHAKDWDCFAEFADLEVKQPGPIQNLRWGVDMAFYMVREFTNLLVFKELPVRMDEVGSSRDPNDA